MTRLPIPPDDHPEHSPEQATKMPGRGKSRLRVSHRDQVEFRRSLLDARLDLDSQARVVWAHVRRLNLDASLADTKAVEGHVSRDTTDPRLLVALCVFATLKGIGSARDMERSARTISLTNDSAAVAR